MLVLDCPMYILISLQYSVFKKLKTVSTKYILKQNFVTLELIILVSDTLGCTLPVWFDFDELYKLCIAFAFSAGMMCGGVVVLLFQMIKIADMQLDHQNVVQRFDTIESSSIGSTTQ